MLSNSLRLNFLNTKQHHEAELLTKISKKVSVLTSSYVIAKLQEALVHCSKGLQSGKLLLIFLLT